jgi:hypothetical protein
MLADQLSDGVGWNWWGLAEAPRAGSSLIIHTASPSLGIGRVLAIACFFDYSPSLGTLCVMFPQITSRLPREKKRAEIPC